MNLGVRGLGGVFLYADDPKTLSQWYSDHFGLAFAEWEPGSCFGLEFPCTDPDGTQSQLIFSIMKARQPLAPGRPECVVNWRIGDLDSFCEQLAQAGVPLESREDSEFGRFAWIRDPEGHRVELYQPPQKQGQV